MKMLSPKEIKEKNKGIYEVEGSLPDILKYLEDNLDLKEPNDFVLVLNQTIKDYGLRTNNNRKKVIVEYRRYPKMIHLISNKAYYRFVDSGVGHSRNNGVRIIQKWTVPALKNVDYELFR